MRSILELLFLFETYSRYSGRRLMFQCITMNHRFEDSKLKLTYRLQVGISFFHLWVNRNQYLDKLHIQGHYIIPRTPDILIRLRCTEAEETQKLESYFPLWSMSKPCQKWFHLETLLDWKAPLKLEYTPHKPSWNNHISKSHYHRKSRHLHKKAY